MFSEKVCVVGLLLMMGPLAFSQEPLESAADQPPQVVYPRPQEVVEDSVGGIEDYQLTPEQIDRIKKVFLERERAKATPYVSLPTPITRTLMLSLDPGVSPPVLRLSRGQQTSLVFSDVSGQPWYIENVTMNRENFTDGKGGDSKGGGDSAQKPSNVLTIEPLNPASYGNVTITLHGLSTPVIFILTTGQNEVDMRLDAKIPGRNPDAVGSVAVSSMPSIDDALSSFLDGVPPKDARRLRVTGLNGTEAWVYKDSLYVRAKEANAQYPAYVAAARSTSGVSVYRYGETHNTITFTTGGQAVTVFIE